MSIPGFDPNTAGNHEEIEMQFAVKTVEHLEAYQKLLYALPPSKLKLTKVDDELFEDFKATFPELATPEALAKLDESEMKSEAGKEKWRNFIMKYEKVIPDYNFGTMLRPDAKREYDQDNNMFVTRTQFYAIEVARNRLGVNDDLHNSAKAKK
ncbi:hypothetical protein NliqN6_6531 [Naganishia liquefaciens]|uniref:Polysaccharide biosynthesis domain-containing protein n=1 Tax=Naganishia liquefaciens TaxID=104408 RepID=A0A8H3YHP9_9TREE|nr:hypothetical protein NliqN6_6531 [Naganishia liquefaciens]